MIEYLPGAGPNSGAVAPDIEFVGGPRAGEREAFDPDLKVGERVSDAAREHGLILRSSHDSQMFAPALMVTAEEIEEIVERYRRTLLFRQLGRSPLEIRALGGGATQFSIATGIPQADVTRVRPISHVSRTRRS